MIDSSPLPKNLRKDFRGQKFNRLLVIALDHVTDKSRTVWKCLCDCGNITTARINDLRSGEHKSCGCLAAESTSQRRTTHGMSKTPEYYIWLGIRSRCYRVNDLSYPSYGGRGITVCERWKNSFINFYSDMGNRPSIEFSIERIDNNGPYSPENCKWANRIEQTNNTRRNTYITYNGETKTLSEWARILDIPEHRLRSRITRGTPIEVAFTHKFLPFPKGYHHKKSNRTE